MARILQSTQTWMSVSYLCEFITNNGPFDGLLGFSQGAALSGLLLGYLAQGKVLKNHPAMKLFVSVSGSKFRDPTISEVACKEPIKPKSVHFMRAKDWLQLPSEDLAAAFDEPLIIRHPQGHTVPRLASQLRNWTMNIAQSDTSFTRNNNEPKNRDTPGDMMKPAEPKP